MYVCRSEAGGWARDLPSDTDDDEQPEFNIPSPGNNVLYSYIIRQAVRKVYTKYYKYISVFCL